MYVIINILTVLSVYEAVLSNKIVTTKDEETITLGATPSGLTIVIDHDGGADDAMAIFLAMLYEKYFNGPKVVALTTNHGNVDESQVFVNSQRIVDIANRRRIPIYRGSNSSIIYTQPSDFYFGHDGLGDMDNVSFKAIEAKPEIAAMALIDLSKKYEGALVVVALAPLTNIALASKLDPLFFSRLSQLYVGAGQVHDDESSIHDSPEFNALMDAEAYRIMAQNANPDKVTVLPFSQVKSSLNVSKNWRENVLGAIDTEIIRAQNNYERVSIPKNERWQALDPAVIAIVVRPDLVEEYDYAKNDIILCGGERGLNTNTFVEKGDANVRIVYSIKHEEYKQFLLDVFSSELITPK